MKLSIDVSESLLSGHTQILTQESRDIKAVVTYLWAFGMRSPQMSEGSTFPSSKSTINILDVTTKQPPVE
jgi:hypothetical protein